MNKNKNKFYCEDGTSITYSDLPEGYFYENHFYKSENKCFKALLKDNEITIHYYPNGIWLYIDRAYSSLKELYENNEGVINMPFSKLKYHYEDEGIIHDYSNHIGYSYDRDDDCILYFSKGELLLEIRNNTNILETEEDREEKYFNRHTEQECIKYLKKTIKERIEFLEEYYEKEN